MPGLPDIVMQDEKGLFHFIELKHTMGRAVDLSPHQVVWLDNHKSGSAWIMVRRSGPKEPDTIRVYHASAAMEARMHGIDFPPELLSEEPYDWAEIMGLIAPV
tara:strand:+ start:473 stop:781 length:309 start_codon:yes stop_codon:yes gene_type:complete